MSDLIQKIGNKAESGTKQSKTNVKKPLNADWPKFPSKISIPEKVFNNALVKPDLFLEQDKVNDNQGFVDNPFNQNLNSYPKSSADRFENISRSIPPPSIKASNIPQIEERKYTSQTINSQFKPQNEIDAKKIKPSPASINASTNNFEKLIDTINKQKQLILDSTKCSIESLLMNAIEQVKILSEVNSKCFNEIQQGNSSMNEASADLYSLLNFTRDFFAKTINRDLIENVRKPNFDEQLINRDLIENARKPNFDEHMIDSLNSAAPNKEKSLPEDSNLNKWKECSLVKKFLSMSGLSLSIVTSGPKLIVYSPLINEKRTLNCVQDLKGAAFLWNGTKHIIITGGLARISIDIDVRNGYIINLPKPKPIRLHCMAFINGKPAIIGGLIKSPINIVYVLEGAKWNISSYLSYPRSHATCINVETNVYVFGGVTEGGILKSIEMWDGEKWNLLGLNLPESRSNMGICLAKNEILLFGGNCGSGLKTSFNVWSFDYKNSIINIYDDLSVSYSSKTGNECALANDMVHLVVSEDVTIMYKLPEQIGELSSVGSKEDSYESSFEDKDILDRMKFNE